jgi:outer membrane lipase/esterase
MKLKCCHLTIGSVIAGAALLAGGGTPLQASTVSESGLPFNQVVVFGDSLSDVGNLALATDSTATPEPALPPAYTAGEFTDGPDTTPSTSIVGVWVQQLNNNFLKFSALTPSLSGGNDYAFGGAITGSSSTPPGMADQVNTFLAANAVAPSNALYVFWGGANDILNAASASGATLSSIELAATAAATNINTQIQQIYNAGGRDFLWVNLPPLDKTPAVLSQGALAEFAAAAATTSFNSTWASDISSLKSSDTGINMIGENVDALFTTILADPSAAGFSNVTTPAQGLTGVNPDQYLFWDSIHPTTAADKLLA